MMKSLTHLPDDALTARLYEIRKQERHLLVEFLSYLAEVDKRKTAVALGYANLFAFCTDYLGLTKGSAFRRTKAAWLLGRFPIIADYLTDGRLNLTTLVELRDVLEEKRLVEILDRAAGRTTVANITLHCRAHNLYAAEQDYGTEHMARMIGR